MSLKNDTLNFISSHPFVSIKQISRYLDVPQVTIRQVLKDLLEDKAIAKINALQTNMLQYFYYALKHQDRKSVV